MNPESIRARTGLLDALAALGIHRPSVVLVGAQAVYLRTGHASVALAEFTTDADLAIDPRGLSSAPLIEVALTDAGLFRDPVNTNPGAWLTANGVPIDLMVPEAVAGAGRRAVTLPPHDRGAMRRTVGLEAALVDNSMMNIPGLERGDDRCFTIRVAGTAALLVAKLHKVSDRRDDIRRQDDKDAHDIYRILVSTETASLGSDIRNLLDREISGAVTAEALTHLRDLFAAGEDSPGAMMAGRAESVVGDPARTALSARILAADLLEALED